MSEDGKKDGQNEDGKGKEEEKGKDNVTPLKKGKKGVDARNAKDGAVIESAMTAVLVMVSDDGKVMYTPDVPMKLQKKADLAQIEMMLVQALEGIRFQKMQAMVTNTVRREITQAAPHLADHIVNSLHRKAVEEGKKPGIIVPKH